MVICGGGGALAIVAIGASARDAHCGRCSLRFIVEPANVVVGQHITGTAYDPSGAPVTVEVLNDDGRVLTTLSVLVTLTLDANPGGATLGGTTTVGTVDGIARFTDLTLDKPGNGYTLTASSPSLPSTTSSGFDANSTATTCAPNVSCHTELSTPASNFEVTANPEPNAGTLSSSVNVGRVLACQGYNEQDPNWFEFVMSSANRSKTIVYTIKMPTLTGTPTTTVNDTEACFGAPSVFTTKSGMPAAAGTLPDGTSGFIGLLPNCPASGPCVVSRQSVPDPSNGVGFDVVLTINIPEALAGDPWARS